MNDDDRNNLDDLHSAIDALKKAESALQFAVVHHGPKSREAFVFQVGFARGRLSRVSSRIYGEPVPDLHDEPAGESDP